jgi:hypothetical protein
MLGWAGTSMHIFVCRWLGSHQQRGGHTVLNPRRPEDSVVLRQHPLVFTFTREDIPVR